jgi:ketosteroid isomerase-like protein
MKRKSNLWMTLFSLIIVACQMEKDVAMIERHKLEILETEKAFSALAIEKGLKIAFTMYAAEDAVLRRGNDLIKGKKAIADYYETYKYPNARLEWNPDFIDVSASGDLAYTYGQYKFEAKDKSGEILKDTGIFHTIWKKQPNGKWRYVWD